MSIQPFVLGQNVDLFLSRLTLKHEHLYINTLVMLPAVPVAAVKELQGEM